MKVSFIIILIFSLIEFTHAQDLLSQQKNERLYRTGLELLEKSQFGAARESFQQFVISAKKGELKTAEAEYYLAFCALNLMHADAEKLFSDFIAEHPSHPKSILAYYDMANFY